MLNFSRGCNFELLERDSVESEIYLTDSHSHILTYFQKSWRPDNLYTDRYKRRTQGKMRKPIIWPAKYRYKLYTIILN